MCMCLCVHVYTHAYTETHVHTVWQPEEKKAGSSESDTYVLNNHLRFKIKYHPVDTDGVMTEGSPDGCVCVCGCVGVCICACGV